MATKAIVGEKVGMTQIWDDQHRAIPVTVVRVAPVRVVQVKTPEREGYSALQVTWGHRRSSTLTKPEQGHFDKAGVDPGRRLVELRVDDTSDFEVGQQLTADLLQPGELVDAIAVSKGKGFAGAMKRHNFKGQGASHGNHKKHRSPGSIGACATPSRVFKGTRMAGRMGGQQVTTLNLEIVQADSGARAGPGEGGGARAEGRHRGPPGRGQGAAGQGGQGLMSADDRHRDHRPGDGQPGRHPPLPATGPPVPHGDPSVDRGRRPRRGGARAVDLRHRAQPGRAPPGGDRPAGCRPIRAPSRPRPGPRSGAGGQSRSGRRAPAGPARDPPARRSGSGGGVALGPKPRSLRAEDAEEDDPAGPALGAVGPGGPGSGGPGGRVALRRPEHQGGHRRAGGPGPVRPGPRRPRGGGRLRRSLVREPAPRPDHGGRRAQRLRHPGQRLGGVHRRDPSRGSDGRADGSHRPPVASRCQPPRPRRRGCDADAKRPPMVG